MRRNFLFFQFYLSSSVSLGTSQHQQRHEFSTHCVQRKEERKMGEKKHTPSEECRQGHWPKDSSNWWSLLTQNSEALGLPHNSPPPPPPSSQSAQTTHTHASRTHPFLHSSSSSASGLPSFFPNASCLILVSHVFYIYRER